MARYLRPGERGNPGKREQYLCQQRWEVHPMALTAPTLQISERDKVLSEPKVFGSG